MAFRDCRVDFEFFFVFSHFVVISFQILVHCVKKSYDALRERFSFYIALSSSHVIVCIKRLT